MARKTTIVPVVFAAVSCYSAAAQGPVALKVELQNVVYYDVDTSDFSKFGTKPNITPRTRSGCFFLGNTDIALGDIVAVNGHPAKGVWVDRGVGLCLSPTPGPSQSIADTTWNTMRHATYEILQSDGTPVGTIMTDGLNEGGPSPAGPPAGNRNFAIVGGTGAFLGPEANSATQIRG